MKIHIPFLIPLALALTLAQPAWSEGIVPTLVPPVAGVAAPARASVNVTPSDAQKALDVLQDDKKRADLIDTLRTIAKAAPAAAEAPQAATAPAATPVATLASAVDPDGLGADLLNQISDWISDAVEDFGISAQSITHFPALLKWVEGITNDPARRGRLLDLLWKLAVVLIGALAVEWGLGRALKRPFAELERHAPSAEICDSKTPADSPAELPPAAVAQPRKFRFTRAWKMLQRLPYALGRLVLDLLPVAAFAATGNLVLGAAIHSRSDTRLEILAVVNAYAICRASMCVVRMMVSPGHPKLALVRLSEETAAYVEVWARRILVVAIFGSAMAEIARLLGLYPAAYRALIKLVFLVVHLFLVIIVLQCRRGVARAISAPEGARGTVAALRNRLADIWHYLAILVLFASWFVLAVQVKNGLQRLLHVVVATAAVLIVARLVNIVVLGTLDRIFRVNPDVSQRLPGLELRANRYYPLLRRFVAIVIGIITVVALLQVWGVDTLDWFRKGEIGDRLVSALITISLAAIIAIAIWESTNAAIDRHMTRLTREAQLSRLARLRTLLPMLRTALLIAVVVVVGLTALSEIGVNIGPLLAGAGIVGVAIGFGSQKLVQDLITGIFLLLENAMQVGDQVTLAGLSGTVENLSIRTIKLRAGDGSVHTIPFSAVTSVTNTNRGIGNAAVVVNVSFREDTDKVGEALKQITAEMREDPEFKPMIRGDLQLWGVDRLDGSVVTIAGQIECTDTGRWGVQREFNRRVKKRFQELGIEIANPTHTIILRNLAEESARAGGQTDADAGPSSTSLPQSPPSSALDHKE